LASAIDSLSALVEMMGFNPVIAVGLGSAHDLYYSSLQ